MAYAQDAAIQKLISLIQTALASKADNPQSGEYLKDIDVSLTQTTNGAILTVNDESVILQNGQNGFSPTVRIMNSANATTVVITDINGNQSFTVSDGVDGANGIDGFSPIAVITKSGGYVTISITDINGTTSQTFVDGTAAFDMIANVESSDTATQDYSIDDLVIVNDILYRVTSAITSGSTIIPNTNCVSTTITNELSRMASRGIPTGGNNRQIIWKNGISDYTTMWGDAPGNIISATGTDSTNMITVDDAQANIPIKSLSVNLQYTQDGSGDPSPTNIRLLNGYTGLTLYHSGADTSNPTEYEYDWTSEAGVVGSGTLDVLTGVLTVTHLVIDLSALTWDTSATGSTNKSLKTALQYSFPVALGGSPQFVCEQYKSLGRQTSVNITNPDSKSVGLYYYGKNDDHNRYNIMLVIPVADSPAGKAVYKLYNPQTYQITPAQIDLLAGENNLWVSNNTLLLSYYADSSIKEETISTSGAITKSLNAERIYHFTGSVSSLTLSLNSAPQGKMQQYHFDFNSGSTATTITISGVIWQGGSFVPEANKHYEIDILSGYGVVASW